MPVAHLYIFSDACPSDWLTPGQDNWHTIANFVVQTDPALFGAGFCDVSHEAALTADPQYKELMDALASELPSNTWMKWKTGPGYRERFARSLEKCPQERYPILNALSFRESDLRSSEQAVLAEYNSRIGGIEGRGIGFVEYTDHKNRRCLRHQFVNFSGLHSIEGPDSKLLVLLLMAWRIADLYAFYHRDLVESNRYGFDNLIVTVVSDWLSGDDRIKRTSEEMLQNLIDPNSEQAHIRLTRSPQPDKFSGELFVDNCAGLLNAAISNSDPKLSLGTGQTSRLLNTGWHALVPHHTKITLRSALELVRT